MSTKDFDSGVVDSGVFTGIRVWTTDETNGFDFLNEQHARERILMMFGLDGHKQYKIIATGK